MIRVEEIKQEIREIKDQIKTLRTSLLILNITMLILTICVWFRYYQLQQSFSDIVQYLKDVSWLHQRIASILLTSRLF